MYSADSIFICIVVLLGWVGSSALSAEWVTERLAQFDLKIHDFPETGRGLQTTRDRRRGEVLVKVPQEEAVTVASVLTRFPVLAQAAESTGRTKNGNGVTVPFTDEQVLAVGLILLKHQERDRYALSLPQQYSVLQMPVEFLECLPQAYQKLIHAYRDLCRDYWESMVEHLPQEIARWVTEEEFRWAFATVRSRCVGMDGDDDDRVRTGGQGEIRVLLPGFDLLNHQFGALTRPGLDQQEKVYVIHSQQVYKAWDQVFISYSDHRNNLQMLMTYGFVAPNNPQEQVIFDVADLFHALAVTRPTYFPSSVLQQLWGLMEKLGKHRDLYGWNGQPEESLIKGIAMMADIEKQFLTEPDPTFGSDVVEAMIAARKEQVARSMERIHKAMETYEDEEDQSWKPMLGSIQMFLEEEQRYLLGEGGECSTAGDS